MLHCRTTKLREVKGRRSLSVRNVSQPVSLLCQSDELFQKVAEDYNNTALQYMTGERQTSYTEKVGGPAADP